MRIIIWDIDGVLTDGTVILDENGKELKRINMKDIDAVNELKRRGYHIGAVTAESNSFSEWIHSKFDWNIFLDKVSEKGNAIEEIRKMGYDHITYIGDGKKDISAFEKADLTICPEDAIKEIREKANHILNKGAGEGKIWDVISFMESLESEEDSAMDIWSEHIDGHIKLVNTILVDELYQNSVIQAARIISRALKKRKKVLMFGNGGSAADAQHIAAEFIGRFRKERQALDVEALTVNTSILTAIGNDYSFDDIFSRQVEAMICEGDVVIGITTSGTSENVRKALDEAKRRGSSTILLTGNYQQDCGYDVVLRVASNVTARIQEIHILTGHFWADYVEKRL